MDKKELINKLILDLAQDAFIGCIVVYEAMYIARMLK